MQERSFTATIHMMSRADSPNYEHILNYLRDTPAPVRLWELATALGVRRSHQRELKKSLAHLKRRKMIEELPGGRFRLASSKQSGATTGSPEKAQKGIRAAPSAPKPLSKDRNLLVGRLVTHRDGYGFVVPSVSRPDIDGDLFIPPDHLGDAMHGDLVEARIQANAGGGRPRRTGSGGSRAEGRIIRVLNRAHATVVGVFHRGRSGNTVRPYESRILQEIVIPPGEERIAGSRPKANRLGPKSSSSAPETAANPADLDGAVVDVELTRFPALAFLQPAASSKSWAVPMISAWTSKSSSGSIIFPIAFPTK